MFIYIIVKLSVNNLKFSLLASSTTRIEGFLHSWNVVRSRLIYEICAFELFSYIHNNSTKNYRTLTLWTFISKTFNLVFTKQCCEVIADHWLIVSSMPMQLTEFGLWSALICITLLCGPHSTVSQLNSNYSDHRINHTACCETV